MAAGNNIFLQQVVKRTNKQRLVSCRDVYQPAKRFQTDCEEQRQVGMLCAELTCLNDDLADALAEFLMLIVADVQDALKQTHASHIPEGLPVASDHFPDKTAASDTIFVV